MAVPLTGLEVDDDERYHRGPIESLYVYLFVQFMAGWVVIPLETGRTGRCASGLKSKVEIIPWSSYLFFRALNDIIEGHSTTGQPGNKRAAGTVPTSNVLQAINIC